MSSTKLLLVDDEAPILESLGAFLTRAGYDVSVASDGEAGLAAVPRVRPEIIVTDAPDHPDTSTQPGGGHGLVGGLAVHQRVVVHVGRGQPAGLDGGRHLAGHLLGPR